MPTIHGVFLVVESLGVLITGAAGIGKSELALELVDRGHRLVADDAPEFRPDDNGNVIGHCPPLLQDFLEIRGLGVLNIRRLYGDRAIAAAHSLDLVIDLDPRPGGDDAAVERLFGTHDRREICGRPIASIRLAPSPGRNLAILVETSIRNHLLQRKGYNSAQDFQIRLQEKLGRKTRQDE